MGRALNLGQGTGPRKECDSRAEDAAHGEHPCAEAPAHTLDNSQLPSPAIFFTASALSCILAPCHGGRLECSAFRRECQPTAARKALPFTAHAKKSGVLPLDYCIFSVHGARFGVGAVLAVHRPALQHLQRALPGASIATIIRT